MARKMVKNHAVNSLVATRRGRYRRQDKQCINWCHKRGDTDRKIDSRTLKTSQRGRQRRQEHRLNLDDVTKEKMPTAIQVHKP